jgi:transposase-like protein
MIQVPMTKDRFTGQRLKRTRPWIYRKVIQLLAEPDAKICRIAEKCHVSDHTVRVIREREAPKIAELKRQLMPPWAIAAELLARLEQLTGSLR